MLTYESLLRQAQMRGMPAQKPRGILREYLQILILKEVYKTKLGKKLFFTGGTYLRLAHQLKRFSEDLDFNANALLKSEFEKLAKTVSKELARLGFESDVSFSYWDGIYACQLNFGEVEKAYNIVSKYAKKQGMVIKLETNTLRRKAGKEPQAISGFGELFPCICTERGFLFADKIDALLKKNRARHLYDIIFMLSNNFPIDLKAMKALGINQDPLRVISKAVAGFSNSELKRQAEHLRPFLFEENEADLITNAHHIISSLLHNYKP